MCSCNKTIVMNLLLPGGIMHNLISFNQLAEWKHFEETLDKCNDEMNLINDYYNCLIECNDDQVACKRICRRILE